MEIENVSKTLSLMLQVIFVGGAIGGWIITVHKLFLDIKELKKKEKEQDERIIQFEKKCEELRERCHKKVCNDLSVVGNTISEIANSIRSQLRELAEDVNKEIVKLTSGLHDEVVKFASFSSKVDEFITTTKKKLEKL
jgi:predicted RNase H-like nuclease (RuvC/YqgF family)